MQHALAHLAPGGILVVKEWERRRNLAHAAAFVSDRFISGDHGVSFMSGDELVTLLGDAAPAAKVSRRPSIPPHANNVVAIVAPS